MALGAFIDLSVFQPLLSGKKKRLLKALFDSLRALQFPVTVACNATERDHYDILNPTVYNQSVMEIMTIDKIITGQRLLFCPYKTEARDVLNHALDFQTLELYFDNGFVTLATSKHGRFDLKTFSEEELIPVLIHLTQEYSFCSAFKISDHDNSNAQSFISRGKILAERIPTVEIKRNSSSQNNTIQSAKHEPVDTAGKIRIKPLTNWTTTPHLVQEWSRLLNPGLPFALVENDPDMFLVINSTNEVTPPERTIYFMMEPYGETLYKDYLNQLTKSIKPLFYGCHKHHLNCIEWHLNPNFTSLIQSNVPKTDSSANRKLSVIVSDRAVDPGQKWRLGLVREMDRRSRENRLPFTVDIYGKCASLGFANYKGEIPRISKEIGLVNYKYHFNAENNRINNYITEKFFDSTLCNCYTFYRGCPNISTYFDPAGFTELPEDYDKCIDMISSAMDRDQWTLGRTAIEKNRKDILVKWGLSSRLLGIFNMSRSLVLYRGEEQTYVQYLEEQGFHFFAQVKFDKRDPNWIGLMLANVVNKIPEEQKAYPVVIMLEPTKDDLIYQKCCEAFITNDCDIVSWAKGDSTKHLYNMILKNTAHKKMLDNMRKVTHPSLAHLLFEGVKINYI
jgi:hypothetical protein